MNVTLLPVVALNVPLAESTLQVILEASFPNVVGATAAVISTDSFVPIFAAALSNATALRAGFALVIATVGEESAVS